MNYTISDSRIPLKPGDRVEVGPHKCFVIDRHVASGGFALMYIAHEEGAASPRYVALKELFPRDLENALVQRLEDGKILAWNPFAQDESQADALLQRELVGYFRNEVTLSRKAGTVFHTDGHRVQQNNLDVLNVEGPFTDRKGNVYLAVDTYMGESLRDFVERGFVRDPDGKAQSNRFLLEIIEILMETAIRLSGLHDSAFMYHLDLSPDNIYLAHAAGRTRYMPFIIDYGSAYDRSNPNEMVDHRYTWNPFSAPEVVKLAELRGGCEMNVDETSDTFSIAAVLFYAATGSLFTPEMRFFDEEWKNLIRQAYSLGIPAFTRELSFADDLIEFFAQGLAPEQGKRFRSAKALLGGLQKLKESYQAYGNLLPLVEPDELMSYLVLHKHPLYNYKSQDGDLHILCLGSGQFIKRMILSLVSTGQMTDSHLHIHVVSREEERVLRAELLAAAPLLGEYSNLGRTGAGEWEYVTFTFETVEDALREDVCEYITRKYADARYYLISLGKNKQNIAAAALYAGALRETAAGQNTIINYYCSEDASNSAYAGLESLKLPENIRIDAFADDLSSYSHTIRTLGYRMLKLANLYDKLYDSSATLGKTAKNLLSDSYGQRSSCASALHADYKLACVAPELVGSEDTETIIKAYRDALATPMFGKLLELEHRRWLMFMAAENFRLPGEEEMMRYGFEWVDGKFNAAWKCTGKKLHPCLVPCDSRGIALTMAHWDSIFAPGKNPDEIREEIEETALDPLDKMSLTLRMLALKKCRRILRRDSISHQFDYIADKLAEWEEDHISEENRQVYDRLREQLEETREWILTAANNLEYLTDEGRLDKLQREFDKISVNTEEEIRRLKQLLQVFVEYAKKRDYKKADEEIIEHLMWVVYSGGEYDLVKLQGKETADNVASALMLEPRNVTFLGREVHKGWEKFLRAHQFAGEIRFLTGAFREREDVEQALEALLMNQKRHCVIDITGAEAIMCMAAQNIADTHENVSLIRKRSDNTFENERNFPTAPAHTMQPALTAADIFTLHGAQRQPEEDDYMERLGDLAPRLWDLYWEFRDNWVGITAFFAQGRCSGTGVRFNAIPVNEETNWKEYFRYAIPGRAWEEMKLKAVFEHLEEVGFLRNVIFGQSASGNTVKFCYPYLQNKKGEDLIQKEFNRFFSYKMSLGIGPMSCRAEYRPEEGYYVNIWTERMVDCYDPEKDYSDKRESGSFQRYDYTMLEPVLKRMEEYGLITLRNFSSTETGTDIKFLYRDLAVKKCLLKAGNVLELYVWQQAKQTREFDDCDSNIVFLWEGDEGIKNELDVILTKGLTTLIISCKTAKFKKDHLNEIKVLTERFSVNSKPVIVYSSDQAVSGTSLTDDLRPVKDRAKAMGVYLIDLNVLQARGICLGEKLLRIAEGLDTPEDMDN